MNPEVSDYLKTTKQWQKEIKELRRILLDCGLTEELKWGKPSYSFGGSNVIVIQGFKQYCALLFLKGVLLSDPDGILVKTGVNTHVGRQIRFVNVREIVETEPILRAYIVEAIEKASAKVGAKKAAPPKMPEELENKLESSPSFKTAFEGLTPGKQKGYIFYFSAPKQSKTRESRIEKCTQQILNGIGLHDIYLARAKANPPRTSNK